MLRNKSMRLPVVSVFTIFLILSSYQFARSQLISLIPDLILYNAKVITVDKDFSLAEAVAIKDGKFIVVGSNKEVRSLAGQSTRVVDLRGKTVIPGLMDNHTHQVLAGLSAKGCDIQVNLLRLDSIAVIVKAIEEKVKVTHPGEWIVTSCFYRGPLKEGRFLTRWDLDPVSPNNPVYVMQSGKNIILNSCALKLLEEVGVTKDTPNPTDPEGVIVKDPNTGELTGHFIAGAGDLARKKILERTGKKPKMWDLLTYSQEEMVRGLRAVQKEYNACGITSVRDMGISHEEFEAYQQLWARGESTVRTNLLWGIPARYMTIPEILDRINNYWGPTSGFGDDMLRIGGFKMVVVNDGYWSLSPEKVRAMILSANRKGWQLNIHTGNDEAVDWVVKCLEEADKERPIAGRRFSLEHGIPGRDKEFYQRLKKLGLIIAPNPLLSYYASGRSAYMAQAIAQVRLMKQPPTATARRSPMPIRDWIDSGLIVTGGTDHPACHYDPEHPLLGIWVVVTRNTLAGAMDPSQKASREEALRMYTINNAYATFEENIKGSIEPGKLADLVVLSDDLLTVPEEKIKDITVFMTIVGGKIVYKRAGADIP